MKKIFLLLTLLSTCLVKAQTTFPVEGIRDDRNTLYALTNATIYVDYQTKIEKGTILFREGKIEAVGTSTGITIPKDARIVDLTGQTIYPSFVELSSDYGMSLKESREKYNGSRPIPYSRKKGAYHWNQAVRPEVNAIDHFVQDDKDSKDYIKAGFGTILTHVRNGISRGTGAVVLLADGNENELILKSQASNHLSFSKGTSVQDYPSSLMGSIALIRQTYLDAVWYGNQKNQEEVNLSMEAWLKNQSLPSIFEARDKLDVLRADKIGDEFGVQYLIRSRGDEYQNVDAIAATKAKLIVPLNFPKPMKLDDPTMTGHIPLKKLKHWELAPTNPSILYQKNISFALSADGLKNKSDFLKNLRKAVQYGLPQKEALKALTYNPAMFIGVEKEVGSLQKGMRANLLITDGDLFEEETKIISHYVGGKSNDFIDKVPYEVNSSWKLEARGTTFELLMGASMSKTDVRLVSDGDTSKLKFKKAYDDVYSFNVEIDSVTNWFFTGWTNNAGKSVKGTGSYKGADFNWVATKTGTWDASKLDDKKKDEEKEEDPLKNIGQVTYPFLPYGFTNKELPVSKEVLFKNATVWTNESQGIMEKADVHIKNGKIVSVGENLSSPTATTIDATNMHLTSGIIDEHSHIAASRGLNEGTQASSAEVRVKDIINSEDINIFRQLSGGVTAAQILHGSANPVGGQSGLIKLRWGQKPASMLIDGADGFIKFALGENVKQSNWGEKYKSRFPQTRMGVEQLYFDLFIRAKEYKEEWKVYNSLKKRAKRSTPAPRRDLELEALSEILESKRFITCHSYQQGEINMLMHVADSMGFRINTFTHILEGYKVADKMKKHGVGGSTFSDWWAYKFEVNDAIPYNAAILQRMGIVTAINSDDAEMGRRLNQEAAKTMKYGGMSEEEAWKMVTLNPAKLLHLDNRMGSIKTGKDADLVLWTDHPLSVYAQVKQTYVDGKCLYDQGSADKKALAIQEERNRIITKMKKAIENGETPEKPQIKKQLLYHCDTMIEE